MSPSSEHGSGDSAMLPFRSHLSLAAAASCSSCRSSGPCWSAAHGSDCLASCSASSCSTSCSSRRTGPWSVGSGQNWLALVAYVAVVAACRDGRLAAAAARGPSRRGARPTRDGSCELSELLVADKPVTTCSPSSPRASGAPSISRRSRCSCLRAGPDDLEIVASDGPELGDESLEPHHAVAGHAGVAHRKRRRRRAAATDSPRRRRDDPSGSSSCVAAPSTSTIAACSRSTPTMPHSPSNGPSSATRRCGPTSSRRSTNGVRRSSAPSPTTCARRSPRSRSPCPISANRARAPAEAARPDLLETIEEQTDRLTRLVSTVLDLWRLEAGALRPKRELVSVDDLIDEAAALVERSVDPSRLRRTVPADLPPLEVDPILMAQALANLLENAARHSPPGSRDPGGGGEEVTGRSDDRDRGLRFRTWGSARPARADLRDVPAWNRRRKRRSRTRDREGVRRGSRWPYRGGNRTRRRSTFRADRAGGLCLGRGRGASRRGRETFVTRVLVVDDDPALLRALRIGLDARGFEVIVAHTGAEGLSRAAQATPDLVVLDLGLPDIDGVEVCKRLRQWTDVPVIVLSALDTEDRKVLALDSGADDYVTKPFGMQELEARLRVALRHAAARNPSSEAAALDRGSDPSGPRRTRRGGRRNPGRAHRPRVRPARVSGSQRRQGLHPPDHPPRGVGTRLRKRGPLPTGLREPSAPQARDPRADRSCGPTQGSATSSWTSVRRLAAVALRGGGTYRSDGGRPGEPNLPTARWRGRPAGTARGGATALQAAARTARGGGGPGRRRRRNRPRCRGAGP